MSDKQAQILQQALGLALHYGYHRVSMDEIARACGMSRPALYQHFRNKGDIFQAVANEMIAEASEKMMAIVKTQAPLADRLAASIDAGVLSVIERMEETPHGLELLEMKREFEGPAEHFEAVMLACFTEAYQREGLDGADDLAHQLLYFLEGMKERVKDGEERRRQLRAFLEVQLRGAGKP